ncbi:WXG100-like domain-containing protein [Kitasatospora cineracea]|uniref:WXG100-like domain-containing protein n=1 Tax=Kitasatospora cineracea TaxID=88074 RepID=UPI00367DDCA7
MILLPAELADVLKTVQNNENGKDIFFPDGNEDLIADLAAAWDRWNEAADGHVQGIVQAAQRAMASMSGPAADSFAQYLQKFASGAGSHVATTLQAGQAIAQSLHGAVQAVTGTKNEMIRELQYAKEYMASHPAGKKSDIAQSEGVKQAAAVYHQYIGQVGSNVDGMLRQSAGHITDMTGMAKTCALNSSNGGGAGAGGPAGGPGTGLDGLTPPPGADGGAGSGPGGSGADAGGLGSGAGSSGAGGPGGLGPHSGGAGLGKGKTPTIQPFKPLTPAMPTVPDFTSGSGKLPVYSPLPLSPSGGLSLAGLSGLDTGSALGGGSGSGALSPFGGAGGGAGGGAFGLGGSGSALAGGTVGAAANGLGGAASAVGRAGAGLLSAAGSGRGAGPGGTAAGAHGPGGMGGGGRGGAGKDGKKGNRFLSPSRFGAEIEDEDLPKTDRGILGQAAETDPRDRKWQQARRRWLDDARADGALTDPGTEAAPAETPVTPASENDALALLAGVLRGTDDTDGTADDGPAGPGDTATAVGGEGARTQDATTTQAADRDDAYLDRARTAAARRGHPDAPAVPDVATTSTASTTPAAPTAAAEAKPAPIREEGGYQVPSPFLRAALTRLAAPTD